MTPQDETDAIEIARAIVRHAMKPLVSPDAQARIRSFFHALRCVEEAYGLKLQGDALSAHDILIVDQRERLPADYEWSAYITEDGRLEIAEYVLDDEGPTMRVHQ